MKTNLETLYQIFQQHPVVTTDSRNCPQGAIFFALKGETFNGNTFAKSALEKACSYAVVDEVEFVEDERFLLVDDCLTALQQLAKHHRETLKTPVIGITGSNGKTTTKELIAAVLSRKYNVLFTQGNLNNHIGVPLTLLELRPEHEIAVVEMGANHRGEIAALCEIACPDFGIITNVGKAHLEGFGSFEGVVQTKTELYRHIKTKRQKDKRTTRQNVSNSLPCGEGWGGVVFINAANKILMEHAANLDKICYGLDNSSFFVSGKIAANAPFLSLRWKKQDGQEYTINTQLVGEYNAENVLAAIAIGIYFDVPEAQINEAIHKYVPTNNRSQLTKTAHNELIIDAYNANPTSMSAALQNFAHIAAPLKAVILGDMRELGIGADAEHAAIIQQLERYCFDKVFLVGENFFRQKSKFQNFVSIDKLVDFIKNDKLEGFQILIKGSRGIQLENVIAYL